MNVDRVELQRRFEGAGDGNEVLFATHAWPRVIVEPKIENGEVHYEVDWNPEKMGQLFLDMGLSEKQVSRVNVKFHRRALVNPFKVFGAEVAGAFNPISPNDITIYCDWFLKRLERDRATIERIANHSERRLLGGVDRRRLKREVGSRRLVDYLQTVDSDRSIPFAEDLLANAYQRTLDSVLVHEAKHLLDFKQKSPAVIGSYGLKVAAAYGTDFVLRQAGLYDNIGFDVADRVVNNIVFIGVFLPVAIGEYQIDPLEVRARNFEKQNRGNSEYRNMITITP